MYKCPVSKMGLWIFVTMKVNVTTKIPQMWFMVICRHELAIELIGGYSSRHRSWTKPSYVGPTAWENVNDHSNVHMGVKQPCRCYAHKKYHNKIWETVRGCKVCGIHLCPECSIQWHSTS